MLTPPLRLFACGLLVGGAGAWVWWRPTLAGTPSSPNPTRPNLALPAWDWRASLLPPPLPETQISALTAAWLDLHDTTGAPAGFALRADTLRALLIRLPTLGYPPLLNALLTRTGPYDRRLLAIAFERFSELHPTDAIQWASTHPPAPDFDPLFFTGLALQAWAGKDPAAAADWLAVVTDPGRYSALALALVSGLARTNPASALIQFGPLLWENGAGFAALREPLLAWADRDASGALSWIIAQPDPSKQRLEWIASLSQGSRALNMFTAILSEANLQADREPALRIALHHWSRANPEDVLAWIKAVPEPRRRDDILIRLSQILEGEPPANALPFALALPEGAARISQLETILTAWAKRAPSATLAWIDTHNDPDVATAAGSASAAILAGIARDEPATAIAEWQALQDPKVKAAALPPLLEAWIAQDAAAALNWLQTQDPALQQHRLVRDQTAEALSVWSQKDPEAALRWVEAQPSASQATCLRALFETAQTKTERTAVANLYAKIKAPALRTATLTAHLGAWLKADPAGARAWLATHQVFPAEQTSTLLASPSAP